jgi:hypothetical protein
MISTLATAFRKTITKGKRRRTIPRVPTSCRDTAPDSGRSDPLHDQAHQERSRQPACFVPRTNPEPPQPLPAQGGFGGTRRSRLQLVAKAPSCGAPRDQFHGPIVNLLQPTLDPSSTLLSHLRRPLRPCSQSGNRSARNAPQGARRGPREAARRDGAP